MKYWWLATPALVLLLFLHIIPVLTVLVLSVTEPWGMSNYARIFSSAAARNVFLTTAKISTLTTIITVSLAMIFAVVAFRAPKKIAFAMIAIAVATFWLSVLVRTVAWVVVLRDNGIINATLISIGIIDSPIPLLRNEVGVLIGMVHYMLPIAILPIYTALQSIHPRLFQAAEGLGANSRQVFFAVTLPGCKNGLIAASIIVFISSLGFFVTPAILGGGRVIMIAEYVKLQFDETVRWGLASAASTLLLTAVLLTLILFRRANIFAGPGENLK